MTIILVLNTSPSIASQTRGASLHHWPRPMWHAGTVLFVPLEGTVLARGDGTEGRFFSYRSGTTGRQLFRSTAWPRDRFVRRGRVLSARWRDRFWHEKNRPPVPRHLRSPAGDPGTKRTVPSYRVVPSCRVRTWRRARRSRERRALLHTHFRGCLTFAAPPTLSTLTLPSART